MSEHSKIEWTEATWNPVRGCLKISPGCKHCYAETFAERFRGVPHHPYEQGFNPRLVPEKLLEPFLWSTPKTVFVNSMSDLFQDAVPDQYILTVAEVMLRSPWHTYQVLLKPLQERAYFHLVYATRSSKGIEEFRAIEQRVAKEQKLVRQQAQREYRENRSRQVEMNFGGDSDSAEFQRERQSQLGKAEIKLIEILADGPVRYEVLRPQILELPLVWNADLNDILTKSGRFVIEGLGSSARTPKPGCIIRLNTDASAK